MMSYSDDARKAFWDSFTGEINRAVASENEKVMSLRERFEASETAMTGASMIAPPATPGI